MHWQLSVDCCTFNCAE